MPVGMCPHRDGGANLQHPLAALRCAVQGLELDPATGAVKCRPTPAERAKLADEQVGCFLHHKSFAAPIVARIVSL